MGVRATTDFATSGMPAVTSLVGIADAPQAVTLAFRSSTAVVHVNPNDVWAVEWTAAGGLTTRLAAKVAFVPPHA